MCQLKAVTNWDLIWTSDRPLPSPTLKYQGHAALWRHIRKNIMALIFRADDTHIHAHMHTCICISCSKVNVKLVFTFNVSLVPFSSDHNNPPQTCICARSPTTELMSFILCFFFSDLAITLSEISMNDFVWGACERIADAKDSYGKHKDDRRWHHPRHKQIFDWLHVTKINHDKSNSNQMSS